MPAAHADMQTQLAALDSASLLQLRATLRRVTALHAPAAERPGGRPVVLQAEAAYADTLPLGFGPLLFLPEQASTVTAEDGFNPGPVGWGFFL